VIASHRAGLSVTLRPATVVPSELRTDTDPKPPAADRAEFPPPPLRPRAGAHRPDGKVFMPRWPPKL
jgi:hypothetical protein